MNGKQIISASLLKAYHQVGKTVSDIDLQANVEDFADLVTDIPVDWLERCFKHARMHYANIPSPATVNKAWDSLKPEWRESKKRAELPDRSYENKVRHECSICPVVAVRCATYYSMPCDFIELNQWQKEWLRTAPRQEEKDCFFEKVHEFENPQFMIESYKRIYM